MEPQRKDRRVHFGPLRTLVLVAVVVALVIWIGQAVFMALFAIQEPESIAEPGEVMTEGAVDE